MGGVLSTPGPPGPPGPPGQAGPRGTTGLEGAPGNVAWDNLTDAQKEAAYDRMQNTLSDYISVNSVFAEKVGLELAGNETIVDTITASIEAAGENSKLITSLANTLSNKDPYKSRLKGRDGSIANVAALESSLRPKSMWCADGSTTCELPENKYATKFRVKAGDAIDFAGDAPSQLTSDTPNTNSRGKTGNDVDGTIVAKYSTENSLDSAKGSALEIHGIGRPYPDGLQKRHPKQVKVYDNLVVSGDINLPNGWRISTKDGHLRIFKDTDPEDQRTKFVQHGNTNDSWSNKLWCRSLEVNGKLDINSNGNHEAVRIRRTGGDNSNWNYIRFADKNNVDKGWIGLNDKNNPTGDFFNNVVIQGPMYQIESGVQGKCLDAGSVGQDCDTRNGWRRFKFIYSQNQ